MIQESWYKSTHLSGTLEKVRDGKVALHSSAMQVFRRVGRMRMIDRRTVAAIGWICGVCKSCCHRLRTPSISWQDIRLHWRTWVRVRWHGVCAGAAVMVVLVAIGGGDRGDWGYWGQRGWRGRNVRRCEGGEWCHRKLGWLSGEGLGEGRRVRPRRLGDSFSRLVMPEWVQMWWRTTERITFRGRNGKLGIFQRSNISNRWRWEASWPTKFLCDHQSRLFRWHGNAVGWVKSMHGSSNVVPCRWTWKTAKDYLLLGDERRGEGHGNGIMTRQSSGRSHYFRVRLLRQLVQESVTSSEKAPILEHFRTCRMQLPEVSLARWAILPGYLNEAVIQAQIVSDWILPSGPAFAVVWKLCDDVVANLTQSQHLVGRLRNSHGYECNVGVRWLDVILVALGSRCSFLPVSVFFAATGVLARTIISSIGHAISAARSGWSGGLRAQWFILALFSSREIHKAFVQFLGWRLRQALVVVLWLHYSVNLHREKNSNSTLPPWLPTSTDRTNKNSHLFSNATQL